MLRFLKAIHRSLSSRLRQAAPPLIGPLSLREIFQHAKAGPLPPAWLYLPADSEWTLETQGLFPPPGNTSAQPPGGQKLRQTIDGPTIEGIVELADELAGTPNDEARLEVFLYYFRYETFPQKLGDMAPPPPKPSLFQLDRQAYTALGPELPGTRCERDGCPRGTIADSTLCKPHHFESIKGRPSPFSD